MRVQDANRISRRLLVGLVMATLTAAWAGALVVTLTQPAEAGYGHGQGQPGAHGNRQGRAKGRPFVSPSEPQ